MTTPRSAVRRALLFPADDPIAVLGVARRHRRGARRRDLISKCSSCATTTNAPVTNAAGRAWRGSDASARPVDLVEAVALEPSHLLIEVVGAGP